MYLHAVGALWRYLNLSRGRFFFTCKENFERKVWPRTFCIMDRRVIVCCKVKSLRDGAEGKPSANSANLVACYRPESKWSIHVQDEANVKVREGPNLLVLKNHKMRCGWEWKANQTCKYLVLSEIALGLASNVSNSGVEQLNGTEGLPAYST